MEKHTDNIERHGLITLFDSRALNDPNGTGVVKIVLQDECGDTLWDDVLNQKLKNCDIKNEQKK